MASISSWNKSYSFSDLRGHPDVPGVILRERTTPGVDGTAYDDIGYAGDSAELITKTFCTVGNDVGAAKAAYALMQGEIVSITDNLAQVWYNYVIEKYRALEVQPVVTGVGQAASKSFCLISSWRVKPL